MSNIGNLNSSLSGLFSSLTSLVDSITASNDSDNDGDNDGVQNDPWNQNNQTQNSQTQTNPFQSTQNNQSNLYSNGDSLLMQGLSDLFAGLADLMPQNQSQSAANVPASSGSSGLPSLSPIPGAQDAFDYGLGTGASTDQNYTHISGSDWGDPHYTFKGTTSSGSSVNNSFSNMDNQQDVLHANVGGTEAQIGSNVSQWSQGAQGVTTNTDLMEAYGGDQLDVNKDGTVTIGEGGQELGTLQSGQSYNFGDGFTVTDNGGTVTADINSGNGQDLNATYTVHSYGVDVAYTGDNVTAGGYGVNQVG